jgi:nitrite reductase (NADH) small subunit
MGRLVKIATTKDVPPGTAKAVEAEGRKIALFNSGGAYYAIDDTCTHRGGPLSEGEVEGTVVTCPWHGATYDITTGGVLGPPAPRGVTSYTVRIDGNDIKVEVP